MKKIRCAAYVALSGAGVLGGCIQTPNEIQTYTPIKISNPTSIVRDNEPVMIPLTEVRSRYPNFDPNDFSVGLMSSNWNPHDYDPILATDPPPNLPAQLIDTDRDGQPDTLLVICDLAPHENRVVSVCTPRFSKLAKSIGPREGGGLYVRETTQRVGGKLKSEGPYTPVTNAVLDPAHVKGDGLYQFGGPVFETDTNGWRFCFDSRACFDVIGKKERGLILARNTKEPADLTKADWGASILGEPEQFGAGALGYSENGTVVPMSGFDSINYRTVNNGTAANEVEFLITGAKLGHEGYDIKWRVTHFAGNRFLRHDLEVSRGGHHLAYVMNATGPRKEQSSGNVGWARISCWGTTNVNPGAGGSLGLGILASGRVVNGFVKNPQDVIGIEFDGSARHITFYTLAAWDQEPQGLRSVDDFNKSIDQLAACLNDPVKALNFEKQVDQ
jgi:uncharacterized protein DUF4861